ncbi:MAG: hypothetical protein IPF42_15775 [Candidatus Microthrix sp.]|nr:hypothetical protein [Candidatus Microthrix sp.]
MARRSPRAAQGDSTSLADLQARNRPCFPTGGPDATWDPGLVAEVGTGDRAQAVAGVGVVLGPAVT